ncbi:MAG: PilZ domain-containing protein [Candidatus Omnitrophica bacterium]|nr:PilZ domain-containing protein [Candidatus Omnitrophota bacterium]
MTTFEYRKLFRADAIVKVDYKTTQEPILSGVAFTKNLSQTGICVVMPDKLVANRKLELKIYVSENKEFVGAEGIVLWQKPCLFVPESGKAYYLTGMQIVDMSPEDAIRESDFVRGFLVKKSEEQNKEIITKLEELGP